MHHKENTLEGSINLNGFISVYDLYLHGPWLIYDLYSNLEMAFRVIYCTEDNFYFMDDTVTQSLQFYC